MSKTRILTVLACILLFASVASFAEEHHKAKIFVNVADADDLVELDLSGLEVGESKQLSDSGKEIVVTREEDGYKIDVDGKELHIQSFDDEFVLGKGQHKVFISEDGDVVKLDDDESQVWISAGGEGHKVHKIGIGQGGEGGHVWISADDDESYEEVRKIMVRRLGEGGEAVEVQVIGIGDDEVLTGHAPRLLAVEGESAAERLAKSGLLDGLDEETRQKILDFLKKDEPKRIRVKTVVVGGDEDE